MEFPYISTDMLEVMDTCVSLQQRISRIHFESEIAGTRECLRLASRQLMDCLEMLETAAINERDQDDVDYSSPEAGRSLRAGGVLSPLDPEWVKTLELDDRWIIKAQLADIGW